MQIDNNPCNTMQDEDGNFLRKMMAELPIVFHNGISNTAAPDNAMPMQIDPRMRAMLDRCASARDRSRETMARFGAPGRWFARTPRPANDDTPEGPPEPPVAAPISVTGLVTKRRRRLLRRSGSRQSADARKIRDAGRAAKSEPVTDLTTPSIHSTRQEKPTQKIQAERDLPVKPTHRPRTIAPWADAGEIPRMIACNRALHDFGVPFAFSLNFDPKIIASANDNVRGQLDFYRRRVTRVLKREIGRSVTMWIAIETDDEGRQHIHGGLAMNDDEDPAAFDRALSKAGGGWTRSGSRCADVREQWHPDGWASYCSKRVGRTRRHLREAAGLGPKAHVQIWSVTDDLRDAGERMHNEVRTELAQEGRQRPIAIESTLAAQQPIEPASESPRPSYGHPVPACSGFALLDHVEGLAPVARTSSGHQSRGPPGK